MSRPHAAAWMCPLALLLACTPPPQSTPLAITGVDVIPMGEAGVLEDHTVLIRDGRIAALGPESEVQVPEVAEVVDGSGMWLVPGLFDTHVHLDESDAEAQFLLYLAHGITTVQNMHGDPWHVEMRGRVAAGEVLGPRIVTTGPTTAREQVNSPEKAEALVREQKAAGYDAIKQYGDGNRSMTAETHARLVEAAHEVGMRVVGHAPRNLPFSMVLEHGQDSIDHMEEITYTSRTLLDGGLGPLIDVQFGRIPVEQAGDAVGDVAGLPDRVAPAMAALALDVKESGLAITPTLIAFRTIWRHTTPDYERLREAPELRYIHPARRLEWGPALNGYRRMWEDRREVMDDILGAGFAIQQRMVGIFHDAGVPILTGTDAPLEFVFPGSSLHEELALLVEAGLTPYDALRAATAVPARALGLQEDSGTVAVGKRADLVLLSADPLRDIANAGRIHGVVAAGRWLPRADLDRRLDSLARSYEPLAAAIAEIEPLLADGDPEAMLDAYRSLGVEDERLAEIVESSVNDLGYDRLASGDVEGAVAAFRANVEAFPGSANCQDSLGEALLNAGQLDDAATRYARALEMDPDSSSAERHLEWIRAFQAGLRDAAAASEESLRSLAGDYGARHVRFRDGFLWYHRDENPPRRLLPLEEDTFFIDGVWTFRMRFERDDASRPVRIVGLYSDGRTDESIRD